MTAYYFLMNKKNTKNITIYVETIYLLIYKINDKKFLIHNVKLKSGQIYIIYRYVFIGS